MFKVDAIVVMQELSLSRAIDENENAEEAVQLKLSIANCVSLFGQACLVIAGKLSLQWIIDWTAPLALQYVTLTRIRWHKVLYLQRRKFYCLQ